MKKFLFLYLLAMCLFTTTVFAQINKQQSESIVVEQIYENQLGEFDIYAMTQTRTSSDNIHTYDNDIIAIPYSTCYVFFVDKKPFANWNHDCQYLFMDATNGNYTIVESQKHPADWETDYTAVSLISRPTGFNITPETNNDSAQPLPTNPHLYAVIISGTHLERYWNDVSAIYCTLTDVYGYHRNNIFVHYDKMSATYQIPQGIDLDGDEVADIDYDAYKTSIIKTFQELSGETDTIPEIPKLGQGDQLFVYVTDHGGTQGGHSYIVLPSGQKLFDYELAEYVEDMECAQMIYVMEQCYSGGFVDDLMDYENYDVKCKNRSVHTAANANEPSWAEIHITGGKYDEFVYYWTAAARGFYPDHDKKPWDMLCSTGSFPFHLVPSLQNHPGDYNPDLNGDGFVQMEEAFAYADFMDTWSPNGYYKPVRPGIEEHPMNSNDIGFSSDLLSLFGYAGNAEADTSILNNRNFAIGGNLRFEDNSELTIEDCNVFLNNVSSAMVFDISSALTLKDKVNFSGRIRNNSLKIYGDFNEETGAELTFGNMSVKAYANSFSIEDAIFGNAELYIEQSAESVNSMAIVKDCSFNNNAVNEVGISVKNSSSYNITGNYINGGKVGMEIYYTGYGVISKNIMYDNEVTKCQDIGVAIYNSYGLFSNNNIHDNYGKGLALLNVTDMSISGNSVASTITETQRIMDNGSCEIYVSPRSFPSYFKYNAIVDDDNSGIGTDRLIYNSCLTTASSTGLNLHVVSNNYWGEEFDPLTDFYSECGDGFYYSPIWNFEENGEEAGSAEGLMATAEEFVSDGDYVQATNIYCQIVETYPRTVYAESSLKQLFVLEEETTNNYNGLRNYYMTNDTIQRVEELSTLAEKLAVQCEIKMGNYEEAIEYYEDVIDNPASLEDSVFAIIDLENVYLTMEAQGNRGKYTGRYEEFRPVSAEEHNIHKNYLISLLPGDNKEGEDVEEGNIKEAAELKVMPNPFNDKVRITVRNEEEIRMVTVYNSVGSVVAKVEKECEEIDLSQQPSGIYFMVVKTSGGKIMTGKVIKE